MHRSDSRRPAAGAASGFSPETRNWSKINKMLGQAVIMINQCLNMAIDGALTGKVANNLTTTASGKVLDARQGKALKGYVDDLTTATEGLTTAVAGLAAFLPDTKTLRLASSTAESTKIFDITVDDDGELSATEYTPPSPEPEENNGGES